MLTKRQKQILDFITSFSKKHGFAPSFAEIKKRMKLRSLATIHEHISTLEQKGVLERTKRQARSIVASLAEKMVQVPLLGRIAAGVPIEAIEDKETIAVPQSKLPFSQGNYYALRVAGDSMRDEHISDGDIVLVKEQKTAENGQKVVALLNNSEATLKTFYKEKNRIRLQPANKAYSPIFVDKKTPLAIQGVAVGVVQSLKNIHTKKECVFRLAELFCGSGGLALGTLKASAETDHTLFKIIPIWANDIDKDACETYTRNIHNGKIGGVICGPIEKINLAHMPAFDALAFGFPCNDFSVVGKQRGFSGKFGPLYSYGVKAIHLHNPQWFIAENVSGLQSADSGLTFKKILYDLEHAGKGYFLTPHLYKFEEYGVPQQRHRIIIVGIRKDLGLKFKIPAPTTKYSYVSAQEAIDSPPILTGAPNHELTKQSVDVIERLKYIPAGENAWYSGIPQHLKLRVKGARMSQIYKRLDPKKPAYTITGSGGGGTHVYHWSEHRALTNRERARLQSFPDTFLFEGSKESVRKQIGMAVPPVGAQVVISAVLKTFAGISYEYTNPRLSNGETPTQKRTELFYDIGVVPTVAV